MTLQVRVLSAQHRCQAPNKRVTTDKNRAMQETRMNQGLLIRVFQQTIFMLGRFCRATSSLTAFFLTVTERKNTSQNFFCTSMKKTTFARIVDANSGRIGARTIRGSCLQTSSRSAEALASAGRCILVPRPPTQKPDAAGVAHAAYRD